MIAALPAYLTGCLSAQVTNADWPIFTLQTTQAWRLNFSGGRFDASALLHTPTDDWLTVSDRGPTVYRIEFIAGTNVANLVPLTECFTGQQFASLTKDKGRYLDSEGLAMDAQGRLYLCEEGDRWIVRCDPKTGIAERLGIDWTPVSQFFDASDRNASFEGIAIGDGRLYVANERSRAMIIVVDLATLKVVEHFTVWPQVTSLMGFLHYSDLSWFEGKLWVLCRHHRAVLEVDPKTRKVLAEFHYQQLEDDLDYDKQLPTGIMEGLAVTADAIWLVTDNNGLPRGGTRDIRPTLVKCPRPRSAPAGQ
jgi:hypothetical protein